MTGAACTFLGIVWAVSYTHLTPNSSSSNATK